MSKSPIRRCLDPYGGQLLGRKLRRALGLQIRFSSAVRWPKVKGRVVKKREARDSAEEPIFVKKSVFTHHQNAALDPRKSRERIHDEINIPISCSGCI